MIPMAQKIQQIILFFYFFRIYREAVSHPHLILLCQSADLICMLLQQMPFFGLRKPGLIPTRGQENYRDVAFKGLFDHLPPSIFGIFHGHTAVIQSIINRHKIRLMAKDIFSETCCPLNGILAPDRSDNHIDDSIGKSLRQRTMHQVGIRME